MTPMNTPVRLPCNDVGSIRARSMLSHEHSSSSRCCGSMAIASRGLIPKKPASKSAASCKKPPCRTYVFPNAAGSGSYRVSTFHPRFAGKSVMASRPSRTKSHSASGEFTSPGNRQLIPTTAMGSLAADISERLIRRSRSFSFIELRRAATTFSTGVSAGMEAFPRFAVLIIIGKPDQVIYVHGIDGFEIGIFVSALPIGRSAAQIEQGIEQSRPSERSDWNRRDDLLDF